MNNPNKEATASAAIATPETDARNRAREMQKGWQAKQNGEPRDSCPWDPNSLTAKWWFEGYDSDVPPGNFEPQADEGIKPL